MGININDLAPWAQKYVAEVIAEREKAIIEPAETPKENKLKAKKVQGFLMDGTPVVFASKREYKRYQDLTVLCRAGAICDLQFQKEYVLLPSQTREDGKRERPVTYVADFVYTTSDGKTVVEDSKGYRASDAATYRIFVIKRKLMLWLYGITVHEV